MKKVATRYQIKKIVTAFGLLFLIFGIYGWLVEPNTLKVKYVQIHDEALHDSWGDLRIVHVSDLHLAGWSKKVARLAQRINRLNPDIICVTGDLGQWNTEATEVIEFFEKLESRYGTYAVLGDSDTSSGLTRCFYCHESGNIHRLRKEPVILRDACKSVKLSGKSLTVCGISSQTGEIPQEVLSLWRNKVRKTYPPDLPILVLSHFSSAWAELPPRERVLWLSGNTHGGQIWTPGWLRPLIFRGKDYAHLKGLFRKGEHCWLYVNAGIGTTRCFPLRIGVPPEITVIEIKGGSKQKTGPHV